jgi:magnesium-transporting ATPase (P-type)
MNTEVNEEELLHQAALLAADLYAEEILSNASSLSKTKHEGIDQRELRKSVKSVKKEIKKNIQARKAICAALGSVKNDIRDVTKVVGAALLPLALSGVIAIPITPLAFAIAGLIVFDAGVSAFCAESSSEKKD